MLFDFLDVQVKIDEGTDIHSEEKYYYQMLTILPAIEKKHKDKVISDKRYNRWMEIFKRMEDKYG